MPYMDFITSLISVSLLVAMAIPGFVLKKLKLLPDTAPKTLTIIVLYIGQPFLTISAFSQSPYEKGVAINMLWMFLFASVLLVGSFFLCKPAFIPIKDRGVRGAALASAFLGNCTFMGLPVLQAFFPGNTEAVIYCMVFLAAFNIATWSLGVYALSGEKSNINFKRMLLNPPTVALLIALPLFFFNVNIPVQIARIFDYMGGLTTPLAMIILGIRLGGIPLKELFNSTAVYVSSALKLVIIPLIVFVLLLPLRDIVSGSMLLVTLYVLAAMPAASSVIMFAERFDCDSTTSSKCVLLSSLLSILTIPLLMLLAVFL